MAGRYKGGENGLAGCCFYVVVRVLAIGGNRDFNPLYNSLTSGKMQVIRQVCGPALAKNSCFSLAGV